MIPEGKRLQQPWLRAAATRTVVDALQAGGADVRFVGGCVRDALAGRVVADMDLDMATPELPETVMARLRQAGLKVIPVGLEYGTVSTICDGVVFQVTTLRRDISTDGRRAVVAFTEDWREDAERRDFTINALSASPDGKVFDPLGGRDDLRHGRVRFVGRAADRVREDRLRILRFFRFHGLFGRPPMDADALAACRSHAGGIRELSGERVRDEFMKILLVPDPADMVAAMHRATVLEHILPDTGNPDTGNIDTLRNLTALEARTHAPLHALRRLAALLGTRRGAAKAIAKRLRLSNRAAHHLALLTAPGDAMSGLGETAALRRALRRHGPDRVGDVILLDGARRADMAAADLTTAAATYGVFLRQCADWTPPSFPLTGADVLALGVAEGPAIGAALSGVEKWWEDGACEAGRRQCLQHLIQIIGAAP